MSLAAPDRVTLFGHRECPACREVARKLGAAGWDYTVVEVDIDNPAAAENAALRTRLPRWSGFVPVLDVDGTIVELGQGELWRAFAPWPLAKEVAGV